MDWTRLAGLGMDDAVIGLSLAWPRWLEDLHPADPLTLMGAAALIELVCILLLQRANRRLRRELRQSRAIPSVGASDPAQAELASLYEKALTGSLDRFSVTDVLQFLNAIQETGILDIADKRAEAIHRMVISGGEIIDAFNGDARGEIAVAASMRCREGSFTFIRGDVSAQERVVRRPTMTLLMEAMQTLDEQQVSPKPRPATPPRIRRG